MGRNSGIIRKKNIDTKEEYFVLYYMLDNCEIHELKNKLNLLMYHDTIIEKLIDDKKKLYHTKINIESNKIDEENI